MTADELDEAAAAICRQYQELGLVSYVCRTTPEGNVRMIGMQLPAETVTWLLRTAANAYEGEVSNIVRN